MLRGFPGEGERREKRSRAIVRAIERLGNGDVLVVTGPDRLARSTRDLLNVLGAIADKAAGFKSLRDAWADLRPARAPDANNARRLSRSVVRTEL